MDIEKKLFINQWVQSAYQRPEAMLIYFKEDTTSGTAAVIIITADYLLII